MGQLKFMSREKLIEYLDEELRQSLNALGLYEIDQYGWLDDGELDPEYCGHALWQEKPPELKKLLVLGEEFICLMRSARHSLGLTFLYRDATDSQLNDSGYSCSFYFADTINKLNLASDRIRKFLITAFTHSFPTKESWPPLGKIARGERAYDTFRAPFTHIFNEVYSWSDSNPLLRNNLTNILPLAEKLAHKRSKNQNPVSHLTLFQNQITTAVSNLSMGYPDEALADDPASAPDFSSQELVDWHNTLVEISNLVFMTEHTLRHLNQHPCTLSGPPQKSKAL